MTISRALIGLFLILSLYQSIAYPDLKINAKIASIKNRLLFMMFHMRGPQLTKYLREGPWEGGGPGRAQWVVQYEVFCLFPRMLKQYFLVANSNSRESYRCKYSCLHYLQIFDCI